MSVSTNTKKQCITCIKNGGILTCNGCQQIFCGKHAIEHRQELAGQLDITMQEHDLLQHEIERISVDHSTLQTIDQWEKEYIIKIQSAAETTRKHFQNLTNQSKEKLLQACHDIAVDMCSSREVDDYLENDFIRWKEQLKKLRLEMASQYSVKIIEDQKSITHLITTKETDSKNNEPANVKLHDKFAGVLGTITLGNEGYLAKHTGLASDYAYIRGELLYSEGCHTVRFKLEKCQKPYCIFFGCISSQTALKENAFQYPTAVGWFEYSKVYEHGRCSSNSKKYGYNTHFIKTNDVLHVTFDCDNKQIKLFNQRLCTTSVLKVHTDKIPFPWQLLIVMFHKDDCVRILTNA